MYAIIKDRGRQYKVEKGATILVDRFDVSDDNIIAFDDVVFYTDKDKTLVGTPSVDGVKVTGEVLSEEKGKKIVVFKFKRRKRYRRKQGHRQKYTKVRISEISVTD